MRIVSICPSNTEILAYLGKIDMLIGVDNYSDFPEEVEGVPRVGPDLSIDLDKVSQLEPDLVLASLSVPGMEKIIEGLEAYGLPYIILNPNSLEEISEDIRKIGKAIGCETEADEKADLFLEEINQFRFLSKSVVQPLSIYWEWWPKPIFTPGGTNWLTEISELAGVQNIFGAEEEPNVKTDWSVVRERNPDYIGMVWVGVKEEKMNPDLIRKRPGAEEVTAVKENQIYVMEESLYCRPSPRLLEGLKKLTHLLQSGKHD